MSDDKPSAGDAHVAVGNKIAFSIDEFCAAVSIRRNTFYKLVKAGKIRPSKILSRTVVTRSEMVRFAASLEA